MVLENEHENVKNPRSFNFKQIRSFTVREGEQDGTWIFNKRKFVLYFPNGEAMTDNLHHFGMHLAQDSVFFSDDTD